MRSATLTANLAPGRDDRARRSSDLDAIAERALPAGVRTDLAGESREFRESSGELYFLFLFALVFIFLVLAAQFESFIHPLTILLSVPLAVFGALLIAVRVPAVAQHLFADRAHHADRARDQERDPDRRVREPAPGSRARVCSRRWWTPRASACARSS